MSIFALRNLINIYPTHAKLLKVYLVGTTGSELYAGFNDLQEEVKRNVKSNRNANF
jgi:hypothetical protein